MITGLFMGWTDPFTKKWFPITKMTWKNDLYYTVHLQGMLLAMEVSPAYRTGVRSGLIKLDRVSISDGINVDFRPRMPVNRPYTDVAKLERLGLSTDLNLFDVSSSSFTNQEGTKRLSMLEVFKRAASLKPQAAQIWSDQLAALNPADINQIFNRIPEGRITEVSANFAKGLIEYNRNELLKISQLELENKQIKDRGRNRDRGL
jgi:hypothetical protein